MQIQEKISLKSFNTFGIESIARYFCTFSDVNQLSEILSEPIAEKKSILILGGGSNMLFTGNYNGLVIKNEIKGIELVDEDDQYYYVKSNAGEVWHSFVMHCIEKNYAGLENLSLIPGCVGAGPMQNIGAYGIEIKDVFHSLEAFHLRDHVIQKFNLEDCAFGYRESVFKRKEKNNWVIISVTFRLNKRPVMNTSYGSIEEELDKMQVDKITIKEIARAVINIRTAKLPDPAVTGNAGSFFKNPVVDISIYENIKRSYNSAPCYPLNDHEVKIPAGWLIEQAGWKGKNLGRYGVHDRQALVLVNYGGATGQEIFDLSSSIISDIKQKFGIELEREVNII